VGPNLQRRFAFVTEQKQCLAITPEIVDERGCNHRGALLGGKDGPRCETCKVAHVFQTQSPAPLLCHTHREVVLGACSVPPRPLSAASPTLSSPAALLVQHDEAHGAHGARDPRQGMRGDRRD
jgi:hypothetical protein